MKANSVNVPLRIGVAASTLGAACCAFAFYRYCARHPTSSYNSASSFFWLISPFPLAVLLALAARRPKPLAWLTAVLIVFLSVLISHGCLHVTSSTYNVQEQWQKHGVDIWDIPEVALDLVPVLPLLILVPAILVVFGVRLWLYCRARHISSKPS